MPPARLSVCTPVAFEPAGRRQPRDEALPVPLAVEPVDAADREAVAVADAAILRDAHQRVALMPHRPRRVAPRRRRPTRGCADGGVHGPKRCGAWNRASASQLEPAVTRQRREEPETAAVLDQASRRSPPPRRRGHGPVANDRGNGSAW